MHNEHTSRVYHVTPDGDDSCPGSADHPFRTIQHAADVMTTGDRCVIGRGLYRETVTVTRNGTADQPACFETADGETVVLAGTEPVEADWQPHDGAIWKAHVEAPFEQLFAGGRMRPEARWPSASADQMLDRDRWASATDTGHGWITDPALADARFDATGAVAWLSVAHQFYAWSRPVTEHSPGEETFRYPTDLHGLAAWEEREDWPQPIGEEAPRYVLIGKLDFLTEPGEWCLDRDEGVLYFRPPDGRDPNEMRIEVKQRQLAFDVRADHVQLRGLHFFGTTFRFEDCSHGLVEDCHLRYPTYARIFPDPGRRGPEEARGVISATRMRGAHHTIRRSSLAHSGMAGFAIRGDHARIEDCLVRDVCWNGSLNFVGIQLGPDGPDEEAEGDGAVLRCTARDAGNCLVSVGHMPDNLVRLCHIHDGGRLCKDVSLLYTQLPLVRGTVFERNWVHGCHSPHIALGIRGDDQTRGLTVHHNVVWDCDWEGIIVKGDENEIHHNTCFDNGTDRGYADIRIDSHPEPKKPWRARQWPLLEEQNAHTRAYNNFAVIKGGRPGWHPDNPPGGEQDHNLSGCDPEFVDKDGHDFRPAEGSPLVGAGRKIPGISETPDGESPDIGAYQQLGERWVPGCPEEVREAAETADQKINEAMGG